MDFVIFVLINSGDPESPPPFNHYIVKSLTFYSFTFDGDKGMARNNGN